MPLTPQQRTLRAHMSRVALAKSRQAQQAGDAG